ncbi:uncharacterized protein V6R79_016100 [Siganus canaliculatus]
MLSNKTRLQRLSAGLWSYRRVLLVVLMPLLLLPLPLVIGTKQADCAFVLLLMAVFWVTEAFPLAMTAMLPAIMFPLFGIMTSTDVAKDYFNSFHFLLVGIVCFAAAIEKWGLHRRVALRLISVVGVNPAWLLLGFMSGCAFISMWVQNTSAVTMVMPIVEAVLQQILKAKEEGVGKMENSGGEDNGGLQLDESEEDLKNFGRLQDSLDVGDQTSTSVHMETESESEEAQEAAAASRRREDMMLCKAMCIGISYASNAGGISTLPGTSPNLIFSEYLYQAYPDCGSINFVNWLLLCLPISVIMLVLTWIWLYWLFLGSDFSFLYRRGRVESSRDKAAKKVIQDELNSLGPMSPQEVFTGTLFLLMVLLWLTRSPGFFPGWSALFGEYSTYMNDASVALLLGLLFFIVPAHRPSKKYEAMISWKEFEKCMPWQVALLVGGGFALAAGTESSGLSQWVAELMTPLGDLPIMATVVIASIIITSVTEVASNAATITIFLPILSPLAEAIHVNPLYILIPTTLCSSFSFLLPVSNPTNAVVYAYGHIDIIDMVKAGLGVNVIAVSATMLAVATWAVPLFDLDTYPDWAPIHPGHNITTPNSTATVMLLGF